MTVNVNGLKITASKDTFDELKDIIWLAASYTDVMNDKVSKSKLSKMQSDIHAALIDAGYYDSLGSQGY